MKLAVVHSSRVLGAAVSGALSKAFRDRNYPCKASLYGGFGEFMSKYEAEGPFSKVFLQHEVREALDTGSTATANYLGRHGYNGELFLIAESPLSDKERVSYMGKYPVKNAFTGNVSELIIGMKNYFSENF
jgi:hypothetical protein